MAGAALAAVAAVEGSDAAVAVLAAAEVVGALHAVSLLAAAVGAIQELGMGVGGHGGYGKRDHPQDVRGPSWLLLARVSASFRLEIGRAHV